MMKYFFYTTLTLIFFTSVCNAAVINFKAPATVMLGTSVPMQVFVDTKGESVNSLDISVAYPNERYAFAGYEAENGAITLWVMRPHETSPGVVRFSGVIPGGIDRQYDPYRPEDRAFPVVTLLFKATSAGTGTFSIVDSLILKNDGLGTRVQSTEGTITVSVRERDAGAPSAEAQLDTKPPLPFSLQLVERSSFGQTPRMVIFETSDADSGIKNYEVSTNGRKFTTAESPYPISRKLFPYTVTVRAVDFAGNTQESTLPVRGNVLIVAVALCAAAAIVWYMYRRRRHTIAS